MGSRADISPLSRIMMRVDAVADGKAPADAISTGFPSIDRALGGGVRHGDLVVLGGDVGVGKSALALGMALRASAAGHVVELLTGEMGVDRVLERVLAIEGRATVDGIRQGTIDEATRASLGAAALRLRDTLPRVDRLPASGAQAVAEEVRQLLDAQLVIVDSLQAIPAGTMPQAEEIALAVRLLKRVAMECGVAVIATAHLPALDRERENLRPRLDDFGALGAVKQHADVVLGLYREEMYHPGPAHEGATELSVLKNRGGPTTYVDLYFYRQWLRFEDMVDPDR
ncbi:MAG TPA: DnaB-like helicase C-terminal domain-containing protein [Gemmatimonadaceae bacterium]|nr:DnaB-like helicase C-terminal domain-containing protein [Gemmatimonadaceae bacterium]